MQTKKRAKPVKFGSAAKAKEKPTKVPSNAPHAAQAEKHIEVKKSEEAKSEDLKIKAVAESIIAESLSAREEAEDDEEREEVEVVIELDQEESSKIKDTIEESEQTSESKTADMKFDEQHTDVEEETKPPKEPQHQPENDEIELKEPVQPPAEIKADDIDYPSSDEDIDVVEGKANPESIERDGAFFGAPPDVSDPKKNMIPYFLKVMIVTFILGLVFFGGIYYAVINRGQGLNLGFKPTPEPTKEVVPTPTQKPVDLAKYSITVQNGTSVAGVAAKLKAQLTEAGFKVGAIGNADKDTYTLTEISTGKKVEKEYIEKLKEVLKKSYVLGPLTTLTTGEEDVVVKIGSTSAK